MMRVRSLLAAVLTVTAVSACKIAPSADEYDVIIRGGTLYDGSGAEPRIADLAIADDTIAAIGDLGVVRAAVEIDATGLAVAPGFINMLSWATESLIEDGRSLSDIHQGVTLEVFGEGWSMGPLNE
jgi:N-acyl-D-amino-acid deacylase